MEIPEALEHVRRNSHAVLCTVKQDGTPQLSPVLVGVDVVGRVLVSTQAGSAKAANLRRDPRAWVCVLADEFYGDWVQLGGRVTVVELPEAMGPLVELYRSLQGEHPDWEAYREAMVEDDRVVLRMDVATVGPA